MKRHGQEHSIYPSEGQRSAEPHFEAEVFSTPAVEHYKSEPVAPVHSFYEHSKSGIVFLKRGDNGAVEFHFQISNIPLFYNPYRVHSQRGLGGNMVERGILQYGRIDERAEILCGRSMTLLRLFLGRNKYLSPVDKTDKRFHEQLIKQGDDSAP